MNRNAPHRLTRRGGLRLSGWSSGSAGRLLPVRAGANRRAAHPGARGQADRCPAGISDAELNELIAAAGEEGTLNLATYACDTPRGVSQAFQDAFPGITVEHFQFQFSRRDFVPRPLPEQNAGLCAWDIATI